MIIQIGSEVIWADNGFRPWFSDIVSWLTTAVIFLTANLVEICAYRQYSTSTDIHRRLRTKLYVLHLSTHALLAGLALTVLLVYAYIIQNGEFYGYQILVAVVKVICWLGGGNVILQERRRQLPNRASRGHSFGLILFWIMSFLSVNLPFISWWNHLWWWYLRNYKDKVRFGLWLVEYVLVFLILVVGIRAPALDLPPYIRLSDSEQANTNIE